MKFIRAGICALVLFAVAAHGGVEDWAAAVLEAGAAALIVFWGLRVAQGWEKEIHGHPLLVPLAAFAAVVMFQFVFPDHGVSLRKQSGFPPAHGLSDSCFPRSAGLPH